MPDSPPGQYPYSPDGKPPFGLQTPWPDPLVLAAAVGVVTERIAITTGVHVAPLRHPVVLAKAVATTARVCGGRFLYGIGVGWQREEFEAVGVPFERRGRIGDDLIPALRALWADGTSSHNGREFSFSSVIMEPKPPRIPILVGGTSDAAMRRAARLADGYIMAGDLSESSATLDRLRSALAAEGREGDEDFRVVMPCLSASADEISAALDPIVTDITVMPWPHPGKVDTTTTEKLEHLDAWCAGTLAPLRP